MLPHSDKSRIPRDKLIPLRQNARLYAAAVGVYVKAAGRPNATFADLVEELLQDYLQRRGVPFDAPAASRQVCFNTGEDSRQCGG